MTMLRKQKDPIKEFKIILIILGFIYTVVSGYAMGIAKVQQITFSSIMGNDAFSDTFLDMTSITLNYFPFLTLIGLGYALFGWQFPKIYKQKKQLAIVLGVLGVLWGIVYTLALAPALRQSHIQTQELLSNLPEGMSFLKNLSEQSQIQEYFITLMYMIAPQILIFIKLNKLPKSYA